MGHFYNPPPPSQGSSNATPPLPHDPIPAQGDPPPRRHVATVLAMVAILSSWPADLEPRLQRPNNTQQTKIAPLTLTYGAQRPNPPLSALEIHKIVAQWPVDVGPSLPYQNGTTRRVSAPLLPAQSTTPPTNPALSVLEQRLIVRAWEPDPPLPPRGQTSVFPGSDAPPIQPPLNARTWLPTWQAWMDPVPPTVYLVRPSAATLPDAVPPRTVISLAIWQAWAEPFVRPPTPVSIAPLTLPTGTQPIPVAPLSVPKLAQVVAAWTPDPLPSVEAPSAAWNVPLTAPPLVPLAQLAIRQAWVEPFVSPPRPVSIAALTLATGTSPSPQPPLSVPKLAQVVASWEVTWRAQTAPPNAGWNVPPILSAVAPTRFPAHIYAAWQPPDPLPVQRFTSVVPTFPAVSQPPVMAPRQWLAPLVASWDLPVAVLARPTSVAAITATPAIVQPTRLPAHIYASWVETPLLAQPVVRSIIRATIDATIGARMTLREAVATTLTLSETVITTTTSGTAQAVTSMTLTGSVITTTTAGEGVVTRMTTDDDIVES